MESSNTAPRRYRHLKDFSTAHRLVSATFVQPISSRVDSIGRHLFSIYAGLLRTIWIAKSQDCLDARPPYPNASQRYHLSRPIRSDLHLKECTYGVFSCTTDPAESMFIKRFNQIPRYLPDGTAVLFNLFTSVVTPALDLSRRCKTYISVFLQL